MGSTGMRVHPHHMQAIWHEVVSAGDELAVDAPLADKSTIICRTGQLMLASGTGAWRVRDSMNRVARVLGVTVHVDLSLLSIECTCIEGHESFSEVVSLPTTGVNTHRIWLMEDYIHEIETQGAELTVRGFHNLLDVVEKSNPDYGCLQLGLAAACACGAFVFLLGGGPFEMLCAFVGAGMGNYMRVKMLARKLGQFSCISCGVATACVCYLAALTFLAHFDPAAMNHEAGYIGAMLFVIPGFPLITSGLDLAKNNFTSGIERFVHAITIVGGATIAGWMVAKVIVLTPDEFAPLGLDPFVMCLLRMVASFVGVFGFSIMFNSTPRMALAAGLIGAVSNTARLEMIDLVGMPPEAAALLGATISGLIASVVGLRFALPRISLTVPSIVIMIPGLYLYRAMYYMGDLNMDDAVTWGLRAFVIILCLPIGLAIARMLTDRNWRYDG